MMGVLVQENNVVGSKRRVEARAEHGAHVVRPSRVIRHFRTSVSGHSYVGPDAHAMIVPWPRIRLSGPRRTPVGLSLLALAFFERISGSDRSIPAPDERAGQLELRATERASSGAVYIYLTTPLIPLSQRGCDPPHALHAALAFAMRRSRSASR